MLNNNHSVTIFLFLEMLLLEIRGRAISFASYIKKYKKILNYTSVLTNSVILLRLPYVPRNIFPNHEDIYYQRSKPGFIVIMTLATQGWCESDMNSNTFYRSVRVLMLQPYARQLHILINRSTTLSTYNLVGLSVIGWFNVTL